MIFPFESYSQKSAQVTYIANDGFLVNVEGKKIIFDGLFGGFEGNWCDIPSLETKTKLENSETPFENIDLIFVSHMHSDHFNGDIVIKHMLKNLSSKLICPMQVREKLSLKNDFALLKDRIISYTPDFFKDTLLVVKEFKIKILRLEHSHYLIKDSVTGEQINKHKNIENLGYLVAVGTIRIFHCGDMNVWNETELKNYSLKNEKINIAFLDRGFLANQEGKGIDLILEYLNPENTFFMHIEPKNREIYKSILKQITDVLPKAFVFDNLLDVKELTIQ